MRTFVYWENPDGSVDLPPYINLCMQTIVKNSNEVILINPENIDQFDINLHPGWSDLATIAHRVDYLRPRILHRYGGYFLDIDAVVLRPLSGIEEDVTEDWTEIGFGDNNNQPYIGTLAAKAGSQLMYQWAELQDRYFNPRPAWTHFGADLLWQCEYPETYVQRPLDLVEPFSWQQVANYGQPDADVLVQNDNAILFALFNKNFPDDLKTASEDTILSGNSFFSQQILKAL